MALDGNIQVIEKYDESIVFSLPGYGKAHINCGQPVFIGHMSDKGLHYLRRIHSCHRKECPVCWHTWQIRESRSIQERLFYYYDNYQTFSKMPVHYVISPPQSVTYDTYDSFRILRKKAYEIGRLRHIKGGMMVFHERSLRFATAKEYTKIHCSEGPHFHIIGDGYYSDKIKEFFLEDGWIVKNLRQRTSKDVFGTAFYILDHAGIGHHPQDVTVYPALRHSKHSELASITWFGVMSYNRLKIRKFKGSDDIFCPVCKEEIAKMDWYVLSWMALKDPPGDPFGESNEGPDGFRIDRSVTSWYAD